MQPCICCPAGVEAEEGRQGGGGSGRFIWISRLGCARPHSWRGRHSRHLRRANGELELHHNELALDIVAQRHHFMRAGLGWIDRVTSRVEPQLFAGMCFALLGKDGKVTKSAHLAVNEPKSAPMAWTGF